MGFLLAMIDERIGRLHNGRGRRLFRCGREINGGTIDEQKKEIQTKREKKSGGALFQCRNPSIRGKTIFVRPLGDVGKKNAIIVAKRSRREAENGARKNGFGNNNNNNNNSNNSNNNNEKKKKPRVAINRA